MMDTQKQLLKGIGTIADVTDSYCNLPPNAGTIVTMIQSFSEHVLELDKTIDGQCAMRAIIASLLNNKFRTSGQLWSVDDKGRISNEYVIQDGTRQIIADLMGLPEPIAKG